jgi:predicted esterase
MFGLFYQRKHPGKLFVLSILLLVLQNCYSLPNGYTEHNLEGFRYGLYIPPDFNPAIKYPILVFLHGATDTATHELRWYNKAFLTKNPCIIITPRCPSSYSDRWGNTWIKRRSYAGLMTKRILDSLIKNYSVDTSRIYLYGISMGGFGVFYMLETYPGFFTAAYSVCGGGNPEFVENITNVPFWIFHGSYDNVIPVTESQNLYNAILDAGGTVVRYTEYPGVFHDSWINVSKETTLERWLFSQQKGSVHEKPDPVLSFKCKFNRYANKVYLKWEAPEDQSIDEKNIWCYRIYRNSRLYASVGNETTSFSDSLLDAKTSYVYKICSTNYFFKDSDPSKEILISIPDME